MLTSPEWKVGDKKKSIVERFYSAARSLGITSTMLVKCLLLVMSAGCISASDSWRKPGCHRIGHTRNINIPDCLPFNITTNACRGFCESWSLPSIMLGFKLHPVTSLGQCCNIMESEDVQAKALCLDGVRNLVFKSAISCACYHCQKE